MAALSSLAGLAYPCRFSMHLAKLEAQVVTGAFIGQDTALLEGLGARESPQAGLGVRQPPEKTLKDRALDPR